MRTASRDMPPRGAASYVPGDCDITTCVNAAGIRTPKCIDMREKLEEFGRRGAESAVRPMAVTGDQRFAFLQISLLHGFVEYDLQHERITRIAELPVSRTLQRPRIS